MSETTPEAAFAEALAAFQAEMPTVRKNQRANAGNYSYDYADLTDITEAAAPVLARHGLSWTAAPTITEHGFVLRYALLHSAGHREAGDFPLPDPAKFSAQQIGSWLTYARRYALCAVTGIAPGGDDDDAVKAGDARSADITHAPHRAQRHNGKPPADDWQAPEPERATDTAWLDGFRQRLVACTKPSEVRGLQEEANVIWAEHRLSSDDAAALKAEVKQRLDEIQGVLT